MLDEKATGTFKANSNTFTIACMLEIFFSWIKMRGSSNSCKQKGMYTTKSEIRKIK